MWILHIKSFQGFHLYPIVQSSKLMESHVPFVCVCVCVIMFLPGVLPKCEWTLWSIVAGQKSFSQLPSFSCQPATSDPCENKLLQNYSLCTKNLLEAQQVENHWSILQVPSANVMAHGIVAI